MSIWRQQRPSCVAVGDRYRFMAIGIAPELVGRVYEILKGTGNFNVIDEATGQRWCRNLNDVIEVLPREQDGRDAA